jgi:formate hydrogenlyase subunit 3/multisubunit Na+/H+ antiporter MnhD subunit
VTAVHRERVEYFAIGVFGLLAALTGAGTAGWHVWLPRRCSSACAEVLVFLVGSTLLLEYFEPVRLYVALAGVGLIAVAIWLKLARKGCVDARIPAVGTNP